MFLATTSFPVPLSPVINTEIFVGATKWIYSVKDLEAALIPVTKSVLLVVAFTLVSLVEVTISVPLTSKALLITSNTSLGLKGFEI